jgi:hypothetical protein
MVKGRISHEAYDEFDFVNHKGYLPCILGVNGMDASGGFDSFCIGPGGMLDCLEYVH